MLLDGTPWLSLIIYLVTLSNSSVDSKHINPLVFTFSSQLSKMEMIAFTQSSSVSQEKDVHHRILTSLLFESAMERYVICRCYFLLAIVK